ncbi:phosphoenolpyruvate synthase [Halobacteria archaeon AArc-dxtr1]|nr:phosphoenolpyruvate synthase [Halobacteria archaeon AArc-dxtr1]
MMAVVWLEEVSGDELNRVGGKGASLGELTSAALPVPPGFVVTTDAYRSFIQAAEISEELHTAIDVDTTDPSELAAAAERAQELIRKTPVPAEIRTALRSAYHEIGGGEAFVAVRSSATAEDLPDASFAGQQETFLNVTEESLLDRVRACWASLFTQRALYYRKEFGFDHEDVAIAVVVQEMVAAEKSGVLFTADPTTGAKRTIIEAAWGLGEAVVSGAVSPDNYSVSPSGEIDATIAEKRVMHVKDETSGETVERTVPDEKRNRRVLSDNEIETLVALGEQIENHYDSPQDVEWAIADGETYLLQSRPITTTDDEDVGKANSTDGDGDREASTDSRSTDDGTAQDSLVDGLGSSPGTASGPVRIIRKLHDLDRVETGDIIVTKMTMPDMVPAMKRASGIVTDEGGMTSHAAIVARELGVPAVVGTSDATATLDDGQPVSIDGRKGTVLPGQTETESEREETADPNRPEATARPMTGTKVLVNLSIPEAAERAAATGADGVGLLRMEHMVLLLNQAPERYVEQHGADAYVAELCQGISRVADAFYPRPVRVRTLDAPTDEFRQLDGGEDEPHEHNPMLGYRGIRRSLDRPDMFEHQLAAFSRLYEMGYDNVEIMFPLVNDADDVRGAKRLLERAGIDPGKRRWGVMIETPAAAVMTKEVVQTGTDFVSFGTNDLTQYTLAVDRNNEHVADRFDELHPAVLRLIGDAIATCREHDVETSICGQAGSKPEMIRFLVEEGISSISANVDAVTEVQNETKRVEQRLLLESVR